MFRLVLCTLILVGASSLAHAQGFSAETGLAHCAKIQNGTKRLACYDELARDLQKNTLEWDGDATSNTPGAPATRVIQGFQPSGFGEWVLRDSTPSNGSRDVALAIFTTGQAGGDTGGSLRVALWLRCSNDRTLLYIDWNATVDVGGRAGVRMQTQIDSDAFGEAHWSRYTNHNITGMYSEQASVRLIKQLFGRSVLNARLNEPSAAYSASFNVAGLEQSIAPLRKACDW